jgi:hypothetical protein
LSTSPTFVAWLIAQPRRWCSSLGFVSRLLTACVGSANCAAEKSPNFDGRFLDGLALCLST